MRHPFNTKAITETLQLRKYIVELFITAAVLSLGVNLVSSYLTDKQLTQPLDWLIIGLILVFLTLVTFLVGIWNSRRRKILIDAIISFDVETNRLLKIPGYRFSTELCNTVNAAFAENENLKRLWSEHPLKQQLREEVLKESSNNNVLEFPSQENNAEPVKYWAISKSSSQPKIPLESSTIAIEAVEYLLIDALSINLSKYFHHLSDDQKIKYISEFNRDHIEEFLNTNRFLSILSKPINEREIFKHLSFGAENNDEILEVRGSDESVFRKFRLLLPLESKLKKNECGNFVIENKRFNLNFKVLFKGYSYNLPDGFEFAYLGRGQLTNSTHSMKVQIEIESTIKLKSLISFKNWELYLWMDSFLEDICVKFSFEHFLSEINWGSVSTHFHVLQILGKKNKPK